MIFLARFNPLIWGMVKSVITRSNFCGFARYLDRAPVGLDDPVHDRQSQTGPLARFSGREIGIEN